MSTKNIRTPTLTLTNPVVINGQRFAVKNPNPDPDQVGGVMTVVTQLGNGH